MKQEGRPSRGMVVRPGASLPVQVIFSFSVNYNVIAMGTYSTPPRQVYL